MKKPVHEIISAYAANQNYARTIGNILVSLMMVNVAVGLVQLGQRLFPDWQGMYLVWVAFFVSLEAIYTRQQTRELETRERWIFHVSEWIAFGVGLKILIYLINDPSQILHDLPLWQQDFFMNFFTGEYLLALIAIAMLWGITKFYTRELDDLYDREQDTDWEELGKVQNALTAIRQKLTSRVFMVGALVVALAVFSRIDASAILRVGGKPPEGYSAPIVNVLVYFVLGLILLSQTQFTLLRARWLWQRLPISPEISRNWLRYGFIAFVILAVIVFFLPTDYSLGFFETLSYLLNFLVQAMTVLFLLITLPFTWCLSLFEISTGPVTPTPEPPPPQLPPPSPVGEPVAWLEVLRSLAFWIVFTGVIIFALRFYFSQNTALWNAIIHFPIVRWIAGAVAGLWKGLTGARRQFTNLLRDGLKRARKQRAPAPVQAIRKFFNFSRLNPREKIAYYYLDMLQTAGQRGIERKPSQTPSQFENRLHNEIPEVDPDLHNLTDRFLDARYSRHTIDEQQAQQAGSLWDRIKSVLREWKRPGS